MRPVDVLLEWFLLLLEGLPGHIADVAHVVFIVLQGIRLIPQTSKSIEHDTRDNVGEHCSKENAVYCVIGEPYNLEGLHWLPDSSRYIESQDALHHCLTQVLLWISAGVNIFLVVAEGDRAEDKGKDHSHEADVEQLWELQADSLEDVPDFGVIAENVHDVNEVQGREEKGPNEWHSHINCYSPKLGTQV